MVELLQAYFDEFREFLPKTFRSSPISKQVKAKVTEVMTKNLQFAKGLRYSEKLTLHILSTEPFDLGLLPEVVADLNLNYTYYKWEKIGSEFYLTLYKEKPKEYTWYLSQIFAYVFGYLSAFLLAFVTAFSIVYLFLIHSEYCVDSRLVQMPIIFSVAYILFLSFILEMTYTDIYMWWFRKTSLSKRISDVLHFGSLDSIDKPNIL